MALLQQISGIVNKLINNSLGRLLLIDDGSDLAHQEGTGVVQGLVVNVIRQVLHVVLDRDDTLGGQLLDLLLAVLFPVGDVGILANTKGTTL